MADSKASALTNNTDPQDTDELYLVDDPAGTPASNALTLGQAHRYTINTANVAAFSATGYSLTGSSAVSAIDIAGTWNTTGTPTGIKFNVTDTASDAASLLIDVQVGGTSKFKIDKNGRVDVAYATSGIGVKVTGNGNGFVASSAGSDTTSINGYGVRLQDTNTIEWSNSSNGISGGDTILSRKGAASLQIGRADAASPVAQTLGVQSVVAGTTDTAGANFTIKGSAGTGTGAGGSIIFQVAPAGSSGTSQNSFSTALTLFSNNAVFGNNFCTFGGRVSAVSFMTLSGSNRIVAMDISNGYGVATGYGYTFTGSGDALTSIDVRLVRDAAGTLALRNGTNAQTFNIYNTYTDSSNYERGTINWVDNTNILTIATKGLGTGGVDRGIILQPQGILYFAPGGTTKWRINTSGHFLAGTDNTYDIGASGATRPRTIYVADNVVTGATDFIHETSAALADGAAAASGTLTNAPSAGNPTKWIAINDNGTTRYIPAW